MPIGLRGQSGVGMESILLFRIGEHPTLIKGGVLRGIKAVQDLAPFVYKKEGLSCLFSFNV